MTVVHTFCDDYYSYKCWYVEDIQHSIVLVDSFVNTVCLWLTFRFGEKYYNILCDRQHKMVSQCCQRIIELRR